jgi:hypothetical protein
MRLTGIRQELPPLLRLVARSSPTTSG